MRALVGGVSAGEPGSLEAWRLGCIGAMIKSMFISLGALGGLGLVC